MLKKLENNNIGATSYIEKSMMYLVVFFISTFILDLIILAATMIITSHQLNYVSSKLQFQSGFVGEGVEDGSKHWTNKQIYQYLDSGMKSVGIDGTEYTWYLEYVPDIKNSSTPVTIFISNGLKQFNYITQGNRASIGNLASSQSNSSNIYERSSIKIVYDHYYRFSGRIFYMLHADTKISLKNVFQNRYVG